MRHLNNGYSLSPSLKLSVQGPPNPIDGKIVQYLVQECPYDGKGIEERSGYSRGIRIRITNMRLFHPSTTTHKSNSVKKLNK